MFRKNVLKVLDSFNSGILTFNKVLSAGSEFDGIKGSNIKIGPKYKIEELIDYKNKHNQNKTSELKSYNFDSNKENNKTDKINLSTSNEEIQQVENQRNEEPFLIKSDKLKFTSKSSRIPVGSFSRAMNFGMLGVSLIGNTMSQVLIDKLTLKEKKSYSKYLINESNAEKLSRTLCKMRGAALKFGQILSTFEDIVVPEPIRSALEKARAEADVMPHSQLIKILKNEYGHNWKDKFEYFDENPFAAASIGQVHQAITKNGLKVAVKIQYPGVAQSIDSDLNNLRRLFEYFKVFPKGLYVNELIKNLGNELRMECDYIEEAKKQTEFRELLNEDKYFYVPTILKDYSTKLILCSEMIEGINVDELSDYSQEIRDKLGSKILELCLRELFEFNYMQTDPNPANFYYDDKNKRLNLIDFGAARRYDKDFVDLYMKIVHSAACNDKETLLNYSQKIGFLTGMESKIMLDSHAQSTLAVGEPFNINNPEIFDFGNQDITKKIYKQLPVMLKNRLRAPPTEVYSLHRKLSGAYLICIRLKSRVRSKEMFFRLYDKFYKGRI